MFDIEKAQHEDTMEETVRRAFARCSNFPKDQASIEGLTSALSTAAKRFKISVSAIIAECAETSPYCPTDHDILQIARALRPADIQQGPRSCPHGVCDGSGWRAIFHLHTKHSRDGGGIWTEKQEITMEQFDAWHGPRPGQEVYAGRYRCSCHPPRPEDVESKGRYA